MDSDEEWEEEEPGESLSHSEGVGLFFNTLLSQFLMLFDIKISSLLQTESF